MERKEIVCLNTGEVFESILKASKKHKISYSNISACCSKKYNYVCKSREERLVFLYKKDYDKMTKKEIEAIIEHSKVIGKNGNSKNAKRIICLNDGKIFDCIKDACKFYEIDNGGLSRHLHKHKKYSHVGGLTFSFYNEYFKIGGI